MHTHGQLKREFQEKERRLKSQVDEGRSLLKDSQVAIEATRREVDRKERESTFRVRTLEDDGRRSMQELEQKLDTETRERKKVSHEEHNHYAAIMCESSSYPTSDMRCTLNVMSTVGR
jgi:hypothetical protein